MYISNESCTRLWVSSTALRASWKAESVPVERVESLPTARMCSFRAPDVLLSSRSRSGHSRLDGNGEGAHISQYPWSSSLVCDHRLRSVPTRCRTPAAPRTTPGIGCGNLMICPDVCVCKSGKMSSGSEPGPQICGLSRAGRAAGVSLRSKRNVRFGLIGVYRAVSPCALQMAQIPRASCRGLELVLFPASRPRARQCIIDVSDQPIFS
jgi:hypothetical protein